MYDFFNILIVVLSLVSLMFLAYKGVSVLVVAPLLAMLTALIVADLNPLYALTETYMSTLVNFIKDFFPIFIAGSIFGKIIGVTGASKSIALKISKLMGENSSILAIVLATSVLTYGGVSLFVVVFTIYPLAVDLFRRSDIPKPLIAPAIALGGFTYTMTALPGSPQSINTIPTKALGTNIYAAPVLGILFTVIVFTLGMLYLNKQVKKAKESGNGGYGDFDDNFTQQESDELPSFFVSILPLVIVFIGNYFFTWLFKQESILQYFVSNANANLPESVAGSVSFNPINGIWAVTISLFIASIVAIITCRKFIHDIKKTISAGAVDSLLPIFNTASENGYGGVIKITSGFANLQTVVWAMPLSPIFKMAFATTVLAGIVGSSSAGTALALSIFKEDFISVAAQHDIPLEAVHRVVLLSAGILDTLPHCGAIITLFAATGLTHKLCYKHIVMITMVFTTIATAVCIALFMITGIY